MIAQIWGVTVEDLLTAAKIVGATVAIVAGLAAISKFRPIQWLWCRLVGEPVGTFFRLQVEAVVNPPFASASRALYDHTEFEHDENEKMRAAIVSTMKRLEQIEISLDIVDRRLTSIGQHTQNGIV
jgi:hypothetical protein